MNGEVENFNVSSYAYKVSFQNKKKKKNMITNF